MIALTTASLAVEGGEFTGRDAADGVFGRAGDLSGTPEERGQRIHEQTVEQQLERIQREQGDAARLRAEQIYREQHKN
jgi:hypothetical protein